MTSCFVCATLNLGRKKSTGTEPQSSCCFLGRLHLVQKSFCYTLGVSVGIGVSVGVHIQNVRADVKVFEF